MQKGNLWAATLAAACLVGLGSSLWLSDRSGAIPSGTARPVGTDGIQTALRSAPVHAPAAPLAFEPAAGRDAVATGFVARRARHGFALSSTEAVLTFQPPASARGAAPQLAGPATTVRMQFDGARPTVPGRGLDRLPSVSNYYVSPDRARWRTGVPQFARVQYDAVYPGIDLVFHSRHRELEYDFVVAPGGNPADISLSLTGVKAMHVAGDGDLILDTEAGELRQRAPVAYQERDGRRVPVAARYEQVDSDTVRFRLDEYDRSQALTIDPILEYGTYLGGSGTDDLQDVTVDADGNAYVTGYEWSTDFPLGGGPTAGGFDAFVSKFSASGSLLWTTLYGSTAFDYGFAIALSAATDRVFVAGTTLGEVPTSEGAYDSVRTGDADCIVFSLDIDEGSLVDATLLGGSDVTVSGFWERALGIVVTPFGIAVTGETPASDFPTTANAVDRTYNGDADVVVAVLSADLSALTYATYLGGSGFDSGTAIDLRPGTDVLYVTGMAVSANFPTTSGAFDTTHNGYVDAFVAAIQAGSGQLVYSTYLGGDSYDRGDDIAVDATGQATIGGIVQSNVFPTTPGAADTVRSGLDDGFVARLTATGSALVYSTFVGGTNGPWQEYVSRIALDGSGAVYVVGQTDAPDLPVTPGAHTRNRIGGNLDGFLAKIAPDGSAIAYASYWGTPYEWDPMRGLFVDRLGTAYVAGRVFAPAQSTALPVTSTAFDRTGNGDEDGFLARFARGLNGQLRFANDHPLVIPPVSTLESAVTVAGVTGEIERVTVSVRAAHTFTSDFTFWLVGPDGTTVELSSDNGGGSALGYGFSCAPEGDRTTFDDTATTSIVGGVAPFGGPHRPEQSLSAFAGKSGAGLNGVWLLRARDIVSADAGTVHCWTLNIKLREPQITSISPTSGNNGTAITISGTNLLGGAPVVPTVRIGGVPVAVSSGSNATITGTVGARFTGSADVAVSDSHHRSGVLLDGFTYLATQTLNVTRAGTGTGTVTSSPPGIACGADCTEAYGPNAVVTLTALAIAGSTFTGWSGSGCTGTGTCVVTMSQARNVNAAFTAVTPALTVTRSGSGTGTVTSNPAGIACGADCSESYAFNTGVTLTAAASTGSTFSGWSGEGCTGTGTCVVTMSQARNVTAAFATVAPGPVIETRSPSRGSSRGGTLVVITGLHFVSGTTARVGSQTVAVLLRGTSELSFVTPAATAGPQTITILTPNGQASTGFEFADPSVDTRTGWRRPSFASSRFTAFESAVALLPDDTNGVTDIYVHDADADSVRRVSVSSTGRQASGGESTRAAISPSGRFVAFESLATNLLPGDTNGLPDVFLHDRDSDENGQFDDLGGSTTIRVSVSSSGAQTTGGASTLASVSGTGRWVAFQSGAANLVAGDDNTATDVFVYDRLLGQTRRVSIPTDGAVAGTGASLRPLISQNGRFVAFDSAAVLTTADTNGLRDVYVHDRDLDTDGAMDEPGAIATRRVSVAASGAQALGGDSVDASLTGDGRYVVYASMANTLVPGDTNGVTDVFLHDRDLDGDALFDEPGQVATRRLSVGQSGEQLLVPTGGPRISANGALLVFLVGEASSSGAVHGFGGVAAAVESDPGKSTRGTIPDPTNPNPVPPIVDPPTPGEDTDQVETDPDGTRSGSTVVPPPGVPGSPRVVISDEPEDLATPSISGISPAQGPSSGGTLVAIEGADLAGTLTWNGAPLAPVSQSSRRWTVVAPARGAQPATVSLRFQQDDRRSNAASFTYLAALSTPRWTSHAPSSGLVTGGLAVTVTGSGFETPSVRLGRRAATVTAWTPTTVTFTVPDVPESGPVAVVVTNGDGAEAISGEPFTYVNATGQGLSLVRLEPQSGPATGGTAVTIFGAGFGAGTTVTFSGVPAPTVQLASSSTLVVETPPGAAGPIDVVVSVPGQPPVTLPFQYRVVVTEVAACAGDDLDGDGMADEWERQFGLTAGDPADGAADADNDGRTNAAECQAGTHPRGLYTRYLAEGATGAFFDTRIVVANPSSTPARVLFRYQTSSGLTPSMTLVVPALARRFVRPAALPELVSADFSTIIESDAEVVIDRSMFWSTGPESGIYGSHAESSLASPGTTWYLAEGATHGAFDLFYLLQNPGTVDASVRVRFLRPSGAPIEREYTVPAQRRINILVDAVPGLEATDVSAVFTSLNGAPIIVERAMYRSAGNPAHPFESGHNSAAIAAPSTSWFLAEGATGTFFDTFILLANPNDAAADVSLRYLLPNGTTVTKTYPVAGNSRRTIWMAGEDARLAATSVSTVVTATNGVPIIAERAMWWPGLQSVQANPALFPVFWGEAHNSPGATLTGTKWAVADGETGPEPVQTRTYYLIANTSAFAAQVAVTLLSETDRPPVVRRFTVAANSRFTVPVADLFPETFEDGNRGYSAVFESEAHGGQPPAQIVVERAMYSNAPGLFWAAGTNLLATRLR